MYSDDLPMFGAVPQKRAHRDALHEFPGGLRDGSGLRAVARLHENMTLIASGIMPRAGASTAQGAPRRSATSCRGFGAAKSFR